MFFDISGNFYLLNPENYCNFAPEMIRAGECGRDYVCLSPSQESFKTYIKRRLLTLVLILLELRNFQIFIQNNATIDVCVGIYNSCVSCEYYIYFGVGSVLLVSDEYGHPKASKVQDK